MDNSSGEDLKICPVRMKDFIDFQCQRCSACCRHLEGKVMVESLDGHRIAKHLQQNGQPEIDMAQFYERYTEPVFITNGYPIFTLKTCGQDNACIFLKNGSCSIYPARPRVCRLYPFSVGPGERGHDFEFVLCLDTPHHFSGGKVLVKDWFYKNFNREDREFVKRDYAACTQIAAVMRRLDSKTQEEVLRLLLIFRYFNFNLNEPFLPQYDWNLQELLRQLQNKIKE